MHPLFQFCPVHPLHRGEEKSSQELDAPPWEHMETVICTSATEGRKLLRSWFAQSDHRVYAEAALYIILRGPTLLC
jgi:hypothetical protein